jgi:hypothetical protein
LSGFFTELDKRNAAFAARIKRTTKRDARVNVLVVLHARGMVTMHVARKEDGRNLWEVPARASGALAKKLWATGRASVSGARRVPYGNSLLQALDDRHWLASDR